jgi:hypothetical protein
MKPQQNNLITIILLNLICFILIPDCLVYAFKENTHMILNEFIVKNKLNGFDIDVYIKTIGLCT